MKRKERSGGKKKVKRYDLATCTFLSQAKTIDNKLQRERVRERVRERDDMSRQSLVKDAWIIEAEEASSLVEDLEAKTKNKYPDQLSLREIARSKLLELGVKLDRLESLLHNPPSKPILSESLPATKEDNKNANRCDQDEVKLSFSKDDQELLKPLLIKPSNSYIPMSLRWKTCWGISVVLGLHYNTRILTQAHHHVTHLGKELHCTKPETTMLEKTDRETRLSSSLYLLNELRAHHSVPAQEQKAKEGFRKLCRLDYIDTMEGATLSDRQASAHIRNAGEESVGLRKKLAAQDSGE
ncbi:hypothetical protein Prudu_018406 [Prunus dulcis]|uniref:Uncharacterized protein n=1 Tax=Prunus dulcis TaxID=3755 RepID=A0A4Y1RQP4_PRUDU|nr:hypothetical protein Prudu_018406 [Prunus dulcis]